MSTNKKVINARKVELGDITFRSVLESRCYQLLVEAEFEVLHEPERFTIMEGFYLASTKFYGIVKSKGTKSYKEDERKIRSITYTPDFYIKYKDYDIYIDAKGNPNDTYPIKKKMFLDYLEKDSKISKKKYLFFEPHNIGQIKKTIEIIKSL